MLYTMAAVTTTGEVQLPPSLDSPPRTSCTLHWVSGAYIYLYRVLINIKTCCRSDLSRFVSRGRSSAMQRLNYLSTTVLFCQKKVWCVVYYYSNQVPSRSSLATYVYTRLSCVLVYSTAAVLQVLGTWSSYVSYIFRFVFIYSCRAAHFVPLEPGLN